MKVRNPCIGTDQSMGRLLVWIFLPRIVLDMRSLFGILLLFIFFSCDKDNNESPEIDETKLKVSLIRLNLHNDTIKTDLQHEDTVLVDLGDTLLFELKGGTPYNDLSDYRCEYNKSVLDVLENRTNNQFAVIGKMAVNTSIGFSDAGYESFYVFHLFIQSYERMAVIHNMEVEILTENSEIKEAIEDDVENHSYPDATILTMRFIETDYGTLKLTIPDYNGKLEYTGYFDFYEEGNTEYLTLRYNELKRNFIYEEKEELLSGNIEATLSEDLTEQYTEKYPQENIEKVIATYAITITPIY